jgi:hypothetical protein
MLLRHIHENVLAAGQIHTVVDQIEFYTVAVSKYCHAIAVCPALYLETELLIKCD